MPVLLVVIFFAAGKASCLTKGSNFETSSQWLFISPRHELTRARRLGLNTLPEANSELAPAKWWLEDDPFLLWHTLNAYNPSPIDSEDMP